MAAHITVRWIDHGTLRADGLESLPDTLTGAVWIDVVDVDQDSLAAVAARFSLPPLAVEDCLHFPQRPKIDAYPDVTFLIWLLPGLVSGDGIASQELDVFLGEEHLVTVHREKIDVIDRVAAHAEEYLKRGVEWTLHAILDTAVDEVFPVIESLSDELEELEDLMLSDARPTNLQRLYAAKRALVQLHKVIGPERDVVRGLARLEAFVEPAAYMYFQDIGDHLARVADQVDTYRDVASGTMDIYLSSVSNRMNAIMKQLTIIATIFMPLTLISGIYGMNVVKGMWPPIAAAWSFPAIIGVMLMITVWMLWYFKRRDWW
ncbi:MAG: magnesium/cobalt transporter CorA [Actinobacteria bacterium]|nr:MAG: magnesium/cobalt transporter CorA [Actinomycetota bacterium]